MKIEQATEPAVRELWSAIEPKVNQAEAAEEVGQALATALHDRFRESVVLARVFLTVPFSKLPSANKTFVENLARSAGVPSLAETTPVLSLIGTHGQEADWNDRRKSKGHVGIPLVSSAFVSAIPMISRLLRELGVPLDWIDSHDSAMIIGSLGGSSNVFFVDDAAQAKDQEGRKIIAAQDFVSGYGVKSVFGAGAAFANGQMIVFVAFCRDSFSRSVAETFGTLAERLKNGTVSLIEAGKVFTG